MQVIVSNKASLPARLRDGIFQDRKKQFVDRLRWDLCVTPNGQECDEYDDNFSEYLIVHDAGLHLGSCRVRPIVRSTMVMDHFRNSFPEAGHFLTMQKNNLYELTRFCRCPDLSRHESAAMLELLSKLIDNYRDAKRLSGFIAVVFPHVARFMDTIGMRYIVLSKSTIENEPALLICLTQASEPSISSVGCVSRDDILECA